MSCFKPLEALQLSWVYPDGVPGCKLGAETEYKLWGIILGVSMYVGPQQIWRMSLVPYLQAEVAFVKENTG